MAVPPNIDDVPLPPAGVDGGFNPVIDIPLAVGFSRQREWVRTIIAISLLAVVALLAVGMFVAFINGWIKDDGLKALVAAVFTPILGVFGTVTGFYYGTHAAAGGEKQ